MKKILLFADIGGHEKEQYYHVGDEAMWYETYRWYRRNHPQWIITSLSWSRSHRSLGVREAPHLAWPNTSKYLTFPLLVLKLLIWRFGGISFFSPAELRFVHLILTHDRVHFTGGGNLSSQFRRWLYYCFFVLLTAQLCGKEVILTSQTVGPITGIDRLFAFYILNSPRLIAFRSRMDRWTAFLQYGIFLPQIRSMLDAAYSLPLSSKNWKSPSHAGLTLGLSVHAWSGSEAQNVHLLLRFFRRLARTRSLTLVLIPHHLASHQSETDQNYMQQIVRSLPRNIRVIAVSDERILSSETVPARFIKTLTSKLDLLLTTRYHGLIFALSQNIPSIALHLDSYYQTKNSGALQMFYGDTHRGYEVVTKNPQAFRELWNNAQRLITHLSREKTLLRGINDRVSTNEETLDSLLRAIETQL